MFNGVEILHVQVDLELVDLDQQHAYTHILDTVLSLSYHRKKQLLEDMRQW